MHDRFICSSLSAFNLLISYGLLKSHTGLVPCGLGRAISNKVHDGIDVQAFMLLTGYPVSQGYIDMFNHRNNKFLNMVMKVRSD